MLKRIFAVALIIFCLLPLCSCGQEEDTESPAQSAVDSTGTLDMREYVAHLTKEDLSPVQTSLDLLLHPLKEALAQHGNEYIISWEGNYATLTYSGANRAFEVYTGRVFDEDNPYYQHEDYVACNVMEYLPFSRIEKVIIEGKGAPLPGGITIGMTATQIAEKLGVSSIDYAESCDYILPGRNEAGEQIDVYTTTGTVGNIDYIISFNEDVLARVEIANYAIYVADKSDGDHGKDRISEALKYLLANKLLSLDSTQMSYKGEVYSSFYDSWFYGWQFDDGFFKDYVVHAEKNAPHRIYVSPTADGQPLLFWCDGHYVDPLLSFLGKWRDHARNRYIDIKSISREGIVTFDMYTEARYNTGEMVLIQNLTTALKDIPKDMEGYLQAVYNEESPYGNMQLNDGNVQSGYYIYSGEKRPLNDLLHLGLNGEVSYIPRNPTNDRIGATGNVHVPATAYDYTQPASWGNMENFGRDDPNPDNTITETTPGGAEVLNAYLNQVYATTGLDYANLEYQYLHNYLFPVNNATYHVWESKKSDDPHYIYVDSKNELLVKEYHANVVTRHAKELVYKNHTIVSSETHADQKYVSPDGTISIDLKNRILSKTDSFVKTAEFSELYTDKVGRNDRFIFFTNTGNRFVLNGYVLFDYTTWGATLHITDSNVPNFAIGVYYLSSESFLLDPSVGVVAIPEKSEGDKYLDGKIPEKSETTSTVIREFSGRIIGYIYTDENGKKTAKDFYGRTLGYYYPDRDVTTDFYGKIIARGDVVSSLLFTQSKK